MKRNYKAPTIESKEYAQLENVFAWCDKYPSTEPNCYKGGEGEPTEPGQSESCNLGYPAKAAGEAGCLAGSEGDINP